MRAAQGDPKTIHDFVKHQQRAVLAAQLTAALHKGHRGAHEVHVAGNRLNHQAGDFLAIKTEGLFKLRHVVVFEDHGVLHHLGRHASAGGVAKGCQARAGFDQ